MRPTAVVPLMAAVMLAACDRSSLAPKVISADASGAAPAGPLVIYLHYDYMVSTDPANPHSDAPHQESVDTVVAAFARRGIQLIVDPKHTAIPHAKYLGLPLDSAYYNLACPIAADGDSAVFSRLKAQYFHPRGNQPWHYAIFGHDNCLQTTGVSALPGYDFEVTLGGLFHEPGHLWWPCTLDWKDYGGAGFCTRMEAGTLMHELGHNLDLHHGGPDDINYKPNYLSIMNYRFQWSGQWLAARPGDTLVTRYVVDYSDHALPTLDESQLDERVGLGGLPGDTHVSAYRPYDSLLTFTKMVPANGPIDWNQDGKIESVASADLHYQSGSLYGLADLSSLDDWSHVRAYLLGLIHPGPTVVAHEDAAERPYVNHIVPAGGPAAGGTLVTITGTHLGKATQVLFGSVGPAPAFSIMSMTEVVAIAPPFPYAGGGPVDVIVVSGINPSPSIGPDLFTYQPWVAPVVTRMSPAMGATSGGDTVTISGAHLQGATAVTFGGSPAVSFHVVDDSTLQVSTPPGSPFFEWVSVTNPAGSSARMTFTYVPLPAVQRIFPSSGSDAGGSTVMVTVGAGDTLGPVTGVYFGGVAAADFTQPIPASGGGTLIATSPPGAVGAVDVTIRTAGGRSAAVPADVFSYQPLPTLFALSPAAGSPGSVVQFGGRHLGSTNGVYFYDGPSGTAAAFTVLDDSTVQVVVPSLPRTAPANMLVGVSAPLGFSNTLSFAWTP